MTTRQQRNNVNCSNQEEPVCVETYKCKNSSGCHQEWIPELGLSKPDRDSLLNPVGWLTDSIIDAAQKLLRDVSPVPGLDSVAYGLTTSFPIQHGEFVQILNTGKGHWVTASSIGVPYAVVHIYDSLYSSAGTALESQIARLIHTQQSSIYLDFVDLPVQAGTLVYTVYYYIIIYVLIKVR